MDGTTSLVVMPTAASGVWSGVDTPPQAPVDWRPAWWPAPDETPTTEAAALTYGSVWASTSIISGDTAGVPMEPYRRADLADPDFLHPSYDLLTDSMAQREAMQAHALLHGNGLAKIVRDRRGDPFELEVMLPWDVCPEEVDGEIFYTWFESQEDAFVASTRNVREVLHERDVFHIRGLGQTGKWGYSVLGLARRSWGMGMSAERFGKSHFDNNARPGVILETPAAIDEDTADRWISNWVKTHGGPRNHNRPAIAHGGLKIHPFPINNADSQWLESRKFQRVEVAAWFMIPPHFLGDDTRLAYNSVEAEERGYLNRTLRRWFGRWRDEARKKLLRNRERVGRTHFFKHDVKGLLSADTKERYESYGIALTSEFMTREEVRECEGLPAEPKAGEFRNPNINPAPQPQQDAPEPPVVDREPFRALLLDRAERLIRVESAQIQKAAKQTKTVAGFEKSMTKFYNSHHAKMIEGIAPIIMACQAVFTVTATADKLASDHIEQSKDVLTAVCGQSGDFTETICSATSTWDRRAEDIVNGVFNE